MSALPALPARAYLRSYRHRHPIKLGPIRETEQWSIDSNRTRVRHDYAYKDPASRRVLQFFTEAWIDVTPEQLEFLREHARSCFRRILELKCGNAHEKVQLPLPRVADRARYV